MKRLIKMPLCRGIFFLLLQSPPTLAADVEHGQALHDQDCVRCHSTELYQQPERKIKNLEQLKRQVQQCELANELAWFEEDVADVTEYLNVYFYLFDQK